MGSTQSLALLALAAVALISVVSFVFLNEIYADLASSAADMGAGIP